MLENVLEGLLGGRTAAGFAVSLTGNEGAARGALMNDMMATRCCSVALLRTVRQKSHAVDQGLRREVAVYVSLSSGKQED